ncbi:FAD-dependent oxidoreductase [Deltaproteobacteria bacterium]|nr:FAD-dependent oxidoreductase [Deltaproteobacteria bacterium]
MPKNIETHIVIIGSGGGLAAAVAAAEKGADKIILLEKQGRLGGNTGLAGDIFACESPVQKRADISAKQDEYFKIAMRWAHWNRVDPRIVRAYINKSGDTIRWLEEKGVEFENILPYRGITTHNALGSNKRIMQVLAQKSEDLGVEVLLGTTCKKILREDDGVVTGVAAVNKEGEEIQIMARSVIIATGGFPGNENLMRKYCPDYHEGMQMGKWPYHTGDGLLMADEIGAGIADSIPIFHIGPVLESGYWSSLAFIPYQPYMVWVNKRGKRFIDESWNSHWESGNAVLGQPEKTVYIIWDEQMKQELEYKISGFPEKLRKYEIAGSLKTARDWDGIADWIGADPEVLKATMAEYNYACNCGYDEHYAKDKSFLAPLKRAPYYAIRALTHCGETMGGIKINESMEILDIKNKPIPGLFASGVIADGWQSQTYCTDLFGSACSFALNSGRIAGENAARFVLDK